MKTSDPEPASRRINLYFLVTTPRTPDTIFRYFLALSDFSDAYSRLLKTNLGRRNLWRDALSFRALDKAFATLEEERPDLLLHQLSKPTWFDWPGKYRRFIRLVKRERTPLLLVPEGIEFQPAKSIFTVGFTGCLPDDLQVLTNNPNYTAFRPKPPRSSLMTYLTSRFDETGYAPLKYSLADDLDQQLENNHADLCIISTDIEPACWKVLVRRKRPILIFPGKGSGKWPAGKLSKEFLLKAAKKIRQK